MDSMGTSYFQKALASNFSDAQPREPDPPTFYIPVTVYQYSCGLGFRVYAFQHPVGVRRARFVFPELGKVGRFESLNPNSAQTIVLPGP